MTFIDATVVNVAWPALQADVQATITDVQWVIEAYALLLGALIRVGGCMGDPSRTAQIDWSGGALAVLGLGGIVFGLLEWPPLGGLHPLVIGALAVGVVSLALLLAVERRARNPMLPLALFRSRTFALANILT